MTAAESLYHYLKPKSNYSVKWYKMIANSDISSGISFHILPQSSGDFDRFDLEAHPELKKSPDQSKFLIQKILGSLIFRSGQIEYQEILLRHFKK